MVTLTSLGRSAAANKACEPPRPSPQVTVVCPRKRDATAVVTSASSMSCLSVEDAASSGLMSARASSSAVNAPLQASLSDASHGRASRATTGVPSAEKRNRCSQLRTPRPRSEKSTTAGSSAEADSSAAASGSATDTPAGRMTRARSCVWSVEVNVMHLNVAVWVADGSSTALSTCTFCANATDVSQNDSKFDGLSHAPR